MGTKTVIRYKTEGVIVVDPTDPESVMNAYNRINKVNEAVTASGMERVTNSSKISTIRDGDDLEGGTGQGEVEPEDDGV